MMARRILALSVALAALLAPLQASATDVQTCLGASERGQRARSAGKLREARDQFNICGGDGCPALVRRDCTQWQSEVIGMLPSVVFGAKDKQGRDLFDVTVSMDGETLLKKLDGKSVQVDPGPHSFKFEVAGTAPVVERALVKEGEKTRVITVTFGDNGATSSGNGATSPTPDPDHGATTTERGHTIYPWLVVGAGVVTMVVGAVILVTAPKLPDGCSAATKTCTKVFGESVSDFNQRQERAGQSDSQPTEGLILGGIGLGVVAIGLVWHFLEPSATRSSALRLTPWAAPGSAGGALGASF